MTKQTDQTLSCCLLAVVIEVLLVIGGVELNPGPIGKKQDGSSTKEYPPEAG